jgi:hypothetical protein
MTFNLSDKGIKYDTPIFYSEEDVKRFIEELKKSNKEFFKGEGKDFSFALNKMIDKLAGKRLQ